MKKNSNVRSTDYISFETKEGIEDFQITYFDESTKDKCKYFGLIGNNFGAIVPTIGTFKDGDGETKYSFLDYDINNLFTVSLDKNWPFIFRNLGQGYAQEVVSGKVIRIGTKEEIAKELDKEDDLEWFQSKLDYISSNPLVYYVDDQDYIVVNDEYKILVSRYYDDLDGFREYMDTLDNGAKKEIRREFEETSKNAEAIAFVDNILFDYEKKYSLKMNKRKNQ